MKRQPTNMELLTWAIALVALVGVIILFHDIWPLLGPNHNLWR